MNMQHFATAFAFLGDQESLDTIGNLYLNPKPDWVQSRWPFFFLPSNQSFATIPGLERELRERVNLSMMQRLTATTWPAVVARSIDMSTRFATITSMRHLFAKAEVSKLKRGGQFEVRVVSVPNDYAAPKPGAFVKESMNALADLVERMGSDPASWRTEST